MVNYLGTEIKWRIRTINRKYWQLPQILSPPVQCKFYNSRRSTCICKCRYICHFVPVAWNVDKSPVKKEQWLKSFAQTIVRAAAKTWLVVYRATTQLTLSVQSWEGFLTWQKVDVGLHHTFVFKIYTWALVAIVSILFLLENMIAIVLLAKISK